MIYCHFSLRHYFRHTPFTPLRWCRLFAAIFIFQLITLHYATLPFPILRLRRFFFLFADFHYACHYYAYCCQLLRHAISPFSLISFVLRHYWCLFFFSCCHCLPLFALFSPYWRQMLHYASFAIIFADITPAFATIRHYADGWCQRYYADAFDDIIFAVLIIDSLLILLALMHTPLAFSLLATIISIAISFCFFAFRQLPPYATCRHYAMPLPLFIDFSLLFTLFTLIWCHYAMRASAYALRCGVRCAIIISLSSFSSSIRFSLLFSLLSFTPDYFITLIFSLMPYFAIIDIIFD